MVDDDEYGYSSRDPSKCTLQARSGAVLPKYGFLSKPRHIPVIYRPLITSSGPRVGVL